jgi:hypothetical protein
MIIKILLTLVFLCIILYGFTVTQKGNALGLPLILISLFCVALVFKPEDSIFLANFFGVGRGTDLLLYFSFIGGVILVLLMHLKLRQQSIMITNLARSIALHQSQKTPLK